MAGVNIRSKVRLSRRERERRNPPQDRPEHPARKPFTPAASSNNTVDGAHQEADTGPEFLATAAQTSILVKFIRDRLDLSRTKGTSLAA
jgi:signal transduction histidine kinase